MPPSPARTATERSIIQLALLIGFGVVLVLWAWPSYECIRQIAETRDATEAVHRRFLETDRLLSEVRSGVLEASIDIRDALLDTTGPSNDLYRRQLSAAQADVEHALQRYGSYVRSSAERGDLATLRAKVADFWNATGPILALDEAGRVGEALEMMRQQIVPRRQDVHRMSEGIARLNGDAADDQRAEVEGAYQAMARRTWATGALALILSLVVAAIVTRYANRLERQLRHQTAQNAEGVRTLQRLSEQLVRVQEDERRVLARELHDEVGQALSALKMELNRPGVRHGEDEGRLEDARTIVDATLQNVRNLSRLLHPMVLEDLGLAAAVESYLHDFGRRTGMRVDFEQSGMEGRLSPALEVTIYRIVQEATNNVGRHAGATTCRVVLRQHAGLVTVRIEDDGKGFSPGAGGGPGAARGLGLVGMRERVAGIGGTLVVESVPGKGTRVNVGLPALAPDEPGAADSAS